MKAQKRETKEINNALWEFFFQMVYISPTTYLSFIVVWLLEKLLIISPALMLIFYDTSWISVYTFAKTFTTMAYFNSESAFAIFSYAICGIVQILIVLGIWQIIVARGDSKCNYSLANQVLHLFFLFCSKVLLQVCVAMLSYLVGSLAGIDKFPSYSGIKPLILNTVWQSYLLLTLYCLIALEVLMISVISILFCQDRSLSRKTPWNSNTWYAEVALLFIQIFIQTTFVLDTSNNQLICFILLVLWIAHITLIVWYTKWSNTVVDMAEFFFSLSAFAIQALIIICNVFNWASFKTHYHYALLIPLFSMQFCAIRYLVSWSIMAQKPAKEKEAVEYIEQLISLAELKDKQSSSKLLLMLCAHARECTRADCECRVLKNIKDGDEAKPLLENTKVFIVNTDMPEMYKDGYTVRLLKSLITDMALQYSKSESFVIELAEVYFYFFGNYYYSLEQLNSISSRKPDMLLKQRIYNLRRLISIGLSMEDINDEDTERTAVSISYLKHYHKFLEQAEDSTDLTIKFWSILLNDIPSASQLNLIGKRLFESKYEIMKTVRKISNITSSHVEFLVRYGIFMKFVFHDAMSADQVYKTIIYIKESASQRFFSANSFSIFRGDILVMLLVASIETANNATISEINTEFEQRLKYSRKELVGLSITNIMPPMIAQKHGEFVQKFFQNMESTNIGNPRFRFIKDKEGFYLPCRALKRIVPRLNNGLQVAMFLILDQKIHPYTCYRKDPAERKTAAILCDGNYRIVGFTHEITYTLGITQHSAKDLLRNTTLFDLFPILENKVLLSELLEKEGKVIMFSGGQLQVDIEKEGEGKESPLHPNGIPATNILLWARLIYEIHGGTEKSYTLLVSKIVAVNINDYKAVEGCEGLYVNSIQKKIVSMKAIKRASKKKVAEVAANEIKDNDMHFSPAPSVASMAMVSVSSQSKTEAISDTLKEIQFQSVLKQTPSSIKKLLVGVIVILAGVIALTITNSYVFLDEINNLVTRFELIKMYLLRYKMCLTLASMAKSYSVNLKKTKKTFDDQWRRIFGRVETIAYYNERTRKLLFGQHLDFDQEPITIPDLPLGNRTVMFSHAQLIFMNAIIEYLSYGMYDEMYFCATQTTHPTCVRWQALLDYSYNIIMYSMRYKQDDIIGRLEKEIKWMATQGETSGYIIIGLCIGLVVISLIVIIPVFNWVIRDKSYVLAIFSDIDIEEIKKVIQTCEKLEIRSIRYKSSWLAKYGDNEERFWRKIILEHKKGFGHIEDGEELASLKKEVNGVKDESDFGALSKKRIEELHTKKADKQEMKSASVSPDKLENKGNEKDKLNEESKIQEGAELAGHEQKHSKRKKDDESGSESKNDEIRQKKLMDEALKMDLEKKKIARRDALSEIDDRLKCRSITRLLFILFLFLAYGGGYLYFNFFVHKVNTEAVDMFFVASKRNAYITYIGMFAKDSILNGDKSIISINTNGDGKINLFDMVNDLLEIEEKCRMFTKYATDNVYNNYFKLLARAESSEMCDASDEYNFSQTLPCSAYYTGPTNQGLSAAIAYTVEFNIQYGNRILGTNFSNPTMAAAMKSDQAPTVFTNGVTGYLSPITEYLVTTFYSDAVDFFELIRKLIYAIASCFLIVFSAIYLYIFLRFIKILNTEIWQTHGIVNMIPMFILENNQKVREQVCNRKGLK